MWGQEQLSEHMHSCLCGYQLQNWACPQRWNWAQFLGNNKIQPKEYIGMLHLQLSVTGRWKLLS
jgi:hypothetical protein